MFRGPGRVYAPDRFSHRRAIRYLNGGSPRRRRGVPRVVAVGASKTLEPGSIVRAFRGSETPERNPERHPERNEVRGR